MLTAERNESLTRVGRGTQIGELFLSLPDAVAAEQKEPAKTVSAA